MDSVNGELGNELDVGVETSEVGSDGDLESGNGLGESGVGLDVLGSEGGGSVEDESGLINLDLSGTGSLELLEELSEDGYEPGEGIDRGEASVGLVSASLSNDEVRDGPEDNRSGGDSSGLGLEELIYGLGVNELEVGVG